MIKWILSLNILGDILQHENLIRTAIKHKYDEMLLSDRIPDNLSDSELEEVFSIASKDLLKAVRFFFIDEHLSNFNYNQNKNFILQHENKWGNLLGLLNSYICFSIWFNEVNNKALSLIIQEEENHLAVVLFSLHSRSCLIAKEILILLKNGYPDAAISRWRTLNEVTTTLYFIIENGPDCAKKFLDHNIVDEYNSLKILKKSKENYPDRLAHLNFDSNIFEDLENKVKNLKSLYGSNFSSDYGWIEGFVPKGERYGYRTIEKAVELDHILPFSKLANQYVHASSKSMFSSLSSKSGEDISFDGGIYGLELPIDCTLLSLNLINTKVLSYFSKTENELNGDNVITTILLDYYFKKIRDEILYVMKL
ncbi:hypothetical protein PESP_b0851 [Pseudoalteromonas espejiana DSM 9414]|uniref:Uncharacterized protein n=1 Tax=Pseudoalteromonas espejiana TaxID=28107 RepID=A0A510XZJ1_9GAMM|nr:DUF5677 domain-containing protein [Pseudoalteromonas espejiana]ASM52354.1 hypothetical protein PESP_b0851 [Pseudoalteromonas espejiana DSM 9414]GEK56494.1 hypothetical protein PES01_33390 [Pseudoalteromonas espejiana]